MNQRRTLLSRARARAARVVRRTWMKYALRGVSFNDAHRRLDLAYRFEDPWHMNSDTERVRFVETARIVRETFGEVGSLLEIGCGEGHQSEHFAGVCKDLHGLDVSKLAVERARKRLPRATFYVGDLHEQPWAGETDKFDLVVACEVLYYMSDIPRTLETMSRLGKACLVTYFNASEKKVDPYVSVLPGIQTTTIDAGEVSWKAVWWTP